MLLTRICRITGHRIFRDFSWPNDLEDFKQYNLIYGWNGSGKSTLASLLRHLQRRAPVTEGTVTFRIDGREVHGASLDTFEGQIRVFNHEFVAENVFTAANRLSPIYVIGKESIDKQQRLNALRQEFAQLQDGLASQREALRVAIKAKDDFCIGQARVIKEALGAHGNRYANYNKRNFRDNVDAMIASGAAASSLLQETEKERLLAQARMSPKPRITQALYGIPDLLSLCAQVKQLLRRRVVSTVIESLKSDPAVAEWVRQGLAMHDNATERCRFCDQPLPDGRLNQLEAHFSKEFAQLMQDIDALVSTLETLASNARTFFPPKRAEFYDDLVARYDQAVAGTITLCSRTDAALESLASLLKRKKSSPFDEITGEAECPEFDTSALSDLQEIVDAHNEACAQFQSRIDAALCRLEEGYVAGSVGDYGVLAEKEIAVQAAVTAAQAMDQSHKNEIRELERDIISHRRPAEELNDELQAYLGHSDLQLEVRDTGYTILRDGQEATALSEGERTAIALLYFLKTLTGHDFDKRSGIVVIDDPVSSLDANALFNAFAYIKDHSKDAQQVILLTHNYGFFKTVREWFTNLRGPLKNEWRILMLSTRADKGRRCAHLTDIDPLLKDYESEYHYLFAYIYRLAQAPAASRLEEYLFAPIVARRVLESFLAFRVPHENGLYGRMLAIPCDDTLRSRIYRFVNTHAHKDGIGDLDDDLTILSETKAVLEAIVEFMRHGDREHCERMIACVTSGGGSD